MKRIIKLIKRARPKHSTRAIRLIYDVCVIKKASHGKFVYEKLGCYSPGQNILTINLFRLVFWISKNVSITGGAARILFANSLLQTKS